MPYIKQELRKKYDEALKDFPYIDSKGDLEYIVFKLMKYYIADRDLKYSTLHDCVYAVIHAAEEVKRRCLDVRENQALKENGDVE